MQPRCDICQFCLHLLIDLKKYYGTCSLYKRIKKCRKERGMFSFTFYVARCKCVLNTYGFQVKHLFINLFICLLLLLFWTGSNCVVCCIYFSWNYEDNIFWVCLIIFYFHFNIKYFLCSLGCCGCTAILLPLYFNCWSYVHELSLLAKLCYKWSSDNWQGRTKWGCCLLMGLDTTWKVWLAMPLTHCLNHKQHKS